YAEARAKFLEAARDAGADLATYSHPLTGPDGEALATDVAWLGAPDAPAVLTIVRGGNGVEGSCGAGGEFECWRRGEGARLGPGAAALLIHGLNPHGFAWTRRVTEDNVDLNRNWRDFSRPLGGDGRFGPVAHLLDP